jgi:hypothetical protein
MADDLDRRLPDVPAAFPRPDATVTEDVRHRVLALRRPRRYRRRLGLAAAAVVCAAASVGFTAGYLLRPASVDAATSISIAARPAQAIAYVGGFTLYGSIVNGAPHQPVTIEGKSCGGYEPFHIVGSTTTVQGGAFAALPYGTPPAVSMFYRARWKNGTSDPVEVRVSPRVDLSYASGFFRISVWGDGVFRGAHGVLERHDARLGWVRAGRFTVKSSYGSGGVAYLERHLSRGTNVRAVIPKSQVGRCFIAGFSNIVRV